MTQTGTLRTPTRADAEQIRALMEYYAQANLTDGLPVVPVTEPAVAEFLMQTDRDPDEVLLAMPHLNRECTVKLAAVNAVLAGCLPEYFPVILAAWDSFRDLAVRDAGVGAMLQSTTGAAPFVLVNGPIAQRLGINSKGNVFGSGFRANATIGRAIRLTTMNVFGLYPEELDQSTQGTPAKYSCCIAENEEESPWPSFAADYGFDPQESTVTVALVRGSLYMEARHTALAEHLLHEFVESIARTGRMVNVATTAVTLVLGPEHARLLARAGWSKRELQQFLYSNATRTAAELDRAGKGGQSRQTRWQVPIDHPDALQIDGEREPVHMVVSPETIYIVVAGASNAGISTILETYTDNRDRPPIAKVEAAAN
jgi:hypothetical protein